MALTIYEGIKDDQQVDENIDEEILRLLGLEDVSDLDYDEYKTLLKERMVAGRRSDSDIPSEDTERLTEEFKRVKKEYYIPCGVVYYFIIEMIQTTSIRYYSNISGALLWKIPKVPGSLDYPYMYHGTSR